MRKSSRERRGPIGRFLSSPLWAGLCAILTVLAVGVAILSWRFPESTPIRVEVRLPGTATSPSPPPRSTSIGTAAQGLPLTTPSPEGDGAIATGITMRVFKISPSGGAFTVNISADSTRTEPFVLTYDANTVEVLDDTGHSYLVAQSSHGFYQMQLQPQTTNQIGINVNVNEPLSPAARVLKVVFPLISGTQDVALTYQLR